MTDWPEMTKELSPRLRDLRQAMPEELIALAIAVAMRCDDCIAFHVKAGTSRAEVTEALGMAIYMGAGPSVMYYAVRRGRQERRPSRLGHRFSAQASTRRKPLSSARSTRARSCPRFRISPVAAITL